MDKVLGVVLNFLGQCVAPNAIRGVECSDKLLVWIDDTNYSYSIDSDKETVMKHCLVMHFENSKETISEEQIQSVRDQLGLEDLEIDDAPIVVEVEKPAPKKAKKAKKKIKNKVLKKASKAA